MKLRRLYRHLRSHPRAKHLAHALLFPRHDYRPRWWVRALVNPLVHRVRGRVRWSARLDCVPFHGFELGRHALLESQSLVNNVMGEVSIGARSLVGVGSVVIGPASLGEDVMLAQHVVVSALNHEFRDATLAVRAQPVRTEPIHVADGAWIGANAVVLPGVRVGRNAVVAAGAVVTDDVPDFAVVVGNPARVVRELDRASGTYVRAGATRRERADPDGVA